MQSSGGRTLTDGPKPFKKLKPPKGLKSLDMFGITDNKNAELAKKNAELAAVIKKGSASKVNLMLTMPKKEHVERVKDQIRKERNTKEEVARQRRLKIIQEEIDRGGTTINVKRCFLTDLRVSADVYEEVRIRMIHELEVYARRAEGSAKYRESKTIQIQDVTM